jgi:hypothetical protein
MNSRYSIVGIVRSLCIVWLALSLLAVVGMLRLTTFANSAAAMPQSEIQKHQSLAQTSNALVQSTFTIDMEDWGSVNDAMSLRHNATGGNPGGHICADDAGSGETWYFRAPPEFYGDLSEAYGGYLTFDLKQVNITNQYDDNDIVLVSDNLTLVFDTTENPAATWTSYSVPLVESGWINSTTGQPATRSEFMTVLTNLTELWIRGEYEYGNDTACLDNVALYPPSSGTEPQSTFTIDMEGWGIVNDATSLRHNATGGNPGGHICADDEGSGETWYFRAPPKFYGDLSEFYDGYLTFDLKQVNITNQYDDDDIVLVSDDLTLVFDMAWNPDTTWSSYGVNLMEAGWMNSTTGQPATRSEFMTVLTNLTELWIRGEYEYGNDTACLDNVEIKSTILDQPTETPTPETPTPETPTPETPTPETPMPETPTPISDPTVTPTGTPNPSPMPTSGISGRVTDSSGSPLAGVTIYDGAGNATTTDSDGFYTFSDPDAGSYTITPILTGYTFEPPTRTVSMPSDASGQDFTAIAGTPAPTVFQVDRDGFQFRNFSYSGADWEHFKKTFPNTEMELSNGQHRKGPQRYFQSTSYQDIGKGGNCAGFTAVSLIHFLNMVETVERDLLSPAHRNIAPLYDMPEVKSGDVSVGQSVVKDYIHLYQARQLSREFGNWLKIHQDDTPLQTYQAIKDATDTGTPVAVSVRGKDTGCSGGHRMTAYRTEESGNTGYIYVYDNNYPDDETRRIEVNLDTGFWNYTLGSNCTWNGTSNLHYSPGKVNFPAHLPTSYDTDTALASTDNDIFLSADGEVSMLITSQRGQQSGYREGELVNEIPDAVHLYEEGFNPDDPESRGVEGFLLPGDETYQVDIQSDSSDEYTLTAFGSGSSLSLDEISTAPGTTDQLSIYDSVLDVAFVPTTDDDYCHYITREVSDKNSRDLTSCVTQGNQTTVRFQLSSDGTQLVATNQGDQAIGLTTYFNQVGENAGSDTSSETIDPGESSTYQAPETNEGGSTIYLPIVQR